MTQKLIGVALAVAVPLAIAQTNPTTRPEFEVATVKLNTSGARAVSIGAPSPGRFNAENVWLRFLIQTAWKAQDFQVSGGPGWANSDRYDISAKTGDNANFEQMRLMLQTLLEDRFRLTLHHETKDLPAYGLVMGKGSTKLQATKEGRCRMPNSDAPGSTGASVLPVCGIKTSSPRSLNGTGVSMAQLATALSMTMRRTVLDQTGLAGNFDIHLEWNADQSTPGFFAPGLGPSTGTEPDPMGGSIFTVIQEQLGLKLEATKGPVEVLIIDHAEKPSGN